MSEQQIDTRQIASGVTAWWPSPEQIAEAQAKCPPGANVAVGSYGLVYTTPMPGEALTDKIKPGDIIDGSRVTAVHSNGWDTEPITLREKLWAAVRRDTQNSKENSR